MPDNKKPPVGDLLSTVSSGLVVVGYPPLMLAYKYYTTIKAEDYA